MQYTSDDVAQKLHFIGVPLRFNWQFLERGRFSLYIWVRAAAWSRNAFRPSSAPRPSTNRACSGRRLQPWGAQYRVGGMVGAFYFEARIVLLHRNRIAYVAYGFTSDADPFETGRAPLFLKSDF